MSHKEKIKFSKLRLRNNASRPKKMHSPHPREQISSYFSEISTQNETATEEQNEDLFALNTQLLENSQVLIEPKEISTNYNALNIVTGTPTSDTSFNEPLLSKLPSTNIKCKPPDSGNSTPDDETDFERLKIIKPPKIFEMLKRKKTSKKVQNKKNIQFTKNKFDPSTSDTNNEHLQLAIALSKSLEVFKNPEINTGSQNAQQKNFKQTLDEFGFKSDRTASLFVTTRSNTRLQNRRRFKHLTPVLYLRTEEDRAKIIEEKVSKILTDNNKKCNTYNLNSQRLNNKPRSFLLRDYYNQNATLFNKNSLSLSQMEIASFYNSTVSPTNVNTCVLLRDWSSIPGREKTPPCIISTESKITDTTTPDLDLILENEDKPKKLNISNKSDETNQVTKDRISISPDLFSDNEIENYEDTSSKSSKNIDVTISSSSTIDKNLESDTSLKSVSILDNISPKTLKVKSVRNTSVLCRRNIFHNEENKILLANKDDDSLSSFTDIETDLLSTHLKTKSTLKKLIQNTENKDDDSLSSFEHVSPKKAKSKSPKKAKSPKKTPEKNQIFKNNLLTGDASMVLINAANPNKIKPVSPAKRSLNFTHNENFKNNSNSSEDTEIIAGHSQIMHYESFCDDNIPCFDLTISSDDSHDFGAVNQNSCNEENKTSIHNEELIANKNLPNENDVQYFNENSTDFSGLIINDLDKKNNDSVVDLFENSWLSPKENARNDINSIEKKRPLNEILKDSSKEEKFELNFDETNDLPDAEKWLNESDKKYISNERISEKLVLPIKEDIQKNDCIIVLSDDSKDSQASVETVKLNLNDDPMEDLFDNSITSPIRQLQDNIRARTFISSSEDEANVQNISKVNNISFTSRRKCRVLPVGINYSNNIPSTSQVKKGEPKTRFSRSFSENMIGECQYTSSPILRRKSVSFGSNKNITILNNQIHVERIVKINNLLGTDEEAVNLLYKKSNDDMLFLSQSSIGTASDISDDELNYSCNISLQKRSFCEEIDGRKNLGDADVKNNIEISCIDDLPDYLFEPQRNTSLNTEKPNITLLQTQKLQCKNLIYHEKENPNMCLPKVLKDSQHEVHCNLETDEPNISSTRVLHSVVENKVTIIQMEELPDFLPGEQSKLNYSENETINPPHILNHPRVKKLNTPKINSTSQFACINDSFNKVLNENVQHMNVEKGGFSEINLSDSENEIVDNLNKICTPNSSKINTSKIITPNNVTIIKTKNITPRGNLSDMDTPSTHKELAKYGVKPMKRSKGIKILKYIYDATHPISQQLEEKVPNSSSDSEDDRINKRRKTHQCPTYNLLEFGDNICVNNDIEIIGSAIAESENLADMIFERTQSSKIRSCRIPFHIVWHNFVSNSRELQEKILLYEPLQVESLYARIKNLGFKFHMQDIISFLDKKCITIRIGQTVRVPKRTVSKLKFT